MKPNSQYRYNSPMDPNCQTSLFGEISQYRSAFYMQFILLNYNMPYITILVPKQKNI